MCQNAESKNESPPSSPSARRIHQFDQLFQLIRQYGPYQLFMLLTIQYAMLNSAGNYIFLSFATLRPSCADAGPANQSVLSSLFFIFLFCRTFAYGWQRIAPCKMALGQKGHFNFAVSMLSRTLFAPLLTCLIICKPCRPSVLLWVQFWVVIWPMPLAGKLSNVLQN